MPSQRQRSCPAKVIGWTNRQTRLTHLYLYH